MEVSYLFNPNDWESESYRFHLDEFKKESGIIKGWLVFFHKSSSLIFEYIDADGLKKKEVDVFYLRPKLKEMYPKIENVEFSGFEINVDDVDGFKEGTFSILVDGVEEKIAKVYVKPPLLYVHIAKTAGSTVNKALVDLFGNENSIVHAESFLDWQSKVNNDELSYLSGHIPFTVFNRNRKVKSFKKAITFREPYSHVVSHLCWIRALSLSENFKRYSNHPKYIQILSDKLSIVDFSKPSSISKFISELSPDEFRLLDNTQCRYIRNENGSSAVSESDLESCFENLNCFDFVGIDKNISHFLKEVYDYYGFDKEIDLELKENVSKNDFGFDFSSDELKKSILPLIKCDLLLYDFVGKRFGNV